MTCVASVSDRSCSENQKDGARGRGRAQFPFHPSPFIPFFRSCSNFLNELARKPLQLIRLPKI